MSYSKVEFSCEYYNLNMEHREGKDDVLLESLFFFNLNRLYYKMVMILVSIPPGNRFRDNVLSTSRSFGRWHKETPREGAGVGRISNEKEKSIVHYQEHQHCGKMGDG